MHDLGEIRRHLGNANIAWLTEIHLNCKKLQETRMGTTLANAALMVCRTSPMLGRGDRFAVQIHTVILYSRADPALAFCLPCNVVPVDAALIHPMRLKVAFTIRLRCLL